MSSEAAKLQPQNSEIIVIDDSDEESGAPGAYEEVVKLEPIAFVELPSFDASGSDMAAMWDTGNDYFLCHKRVMKELKEIMTNNGGMDVRKFTVDYEDDSIHKWMVNITGVNPRSHLGLQMARAKPKVEKVVFQFVFPARYPAVPPNVSLITPSLHNFFMPLYGDICLDILNKAWNPKYTAETVIMQIIQALEGPDNILSRAKLLYC